MRNKLFAIMLVFALICLACISICYAENYIYKLRPDIISYLQYKAGNYQTFEFGWYQKDFKETTILYPTIGKNTLSLMIFSHTRVIMRDLGGWTISLESNSPMLISYQIKNQPMISVDKSKIIFYYNLKRNQMEVVL